MVMNPKADKTETGQERPPSEEADERRFNETVRNLLNTPPKPHEKKGPSNKPDPKPAREQIKPRTEGKGNRR
jgi:hypothetical protein